MKKPEDMRIGMKVIIHSEEGECTIIGFDPYAQKWVAANPRWVMGISHLEEDDYEWMIDYQGEK